ncbi:MAG: NAD(P)/FAD-dependent oxidoreductase [Gammaproteobacteria bacterium]
METCDIAVIGAGVVGLAVARALAKSGREVLVLDQADTIGSGQSSRNSEVIHAGLYYPSDWLKTRLCTAGREALYLYCREKGINHQKMGKLIVASHASELPRLSAIGRQAEANGVPVSWLDAAGARELEPEVRAEAALLSPESGIIDSHELMLALQGDLEAAGGLVALGSPVQGVAPDSSGWRLDVGSLGELACRQVVNAAGLGAQALALSTVGMAEHWVTPLQMTKGHYFTLSGRSPFRRLVYPLPGENSLGIHATHDLSGQARFGPDAVPVESLDYTFDEGRREAFVEAIRRYWPGLDPDRLQPAYTGIRAQLAHGPEGRRDYVIVGPAEHGLEGIWHLLGIESPGLTACLALGSHVAGRVSAGS